MFSRSTGETDDLLGAPAPGGAASGASRGRLTVHRGQLYFGDPSDAASSASEGPYPPPAASSGRRYQGGVAFDETYVDITDASEVSSSDGEYSYVETGSGSESRRQRAAARVGRGELHHQRAGGQLPLQLVQQPRQQRVVPRLVVHPHEARVRQVGRERVLAAEVHARALR